MKERVNILAVDDDEEVLILLRRILEEAEYNVITACGGEEALAMLSEQEGSWPDLVILDIIMPGLNGFELLDIIRQRFDIPIIMLSAKQEVTSVRDALVMGADDYLRKPFRRSELLARVKAKLRRARRG